MLRRGPTCACCWSAAARRRRRCRRRRAQSALRDRVVFTGRVPHAEVQRYYDLVDVLAYPRHSMRLTELVTPLKPLEAMAQGQLFVASDVGGHRELIRDGETGTLFKAGSAETLAAAVVRCSSGARGGPRCAPRVVASSSRSATGAAASATTFARSSALAASGTVNWRELRVAIVGPLPPPAGGMANQTRAAGRAAAWRGRAASSSCRPTRRIGPAWIGGLRGVRALSACRPTSCGCGGPSARRDVVHVMANSRLVMAPVRGARDRVARLRGVPVVVNYRGGEAAGVPRALVERWCVRRSMRQRPSWCPRAFCRRCSPATA